jgi:hypothetical protein
LHFRFELAKYIYYTLDRERGFALILSILLLLVSIAALYFDPNTIPFFIWAAFLSTGVSAIQLLSELFKSHNITLNPESLLIQDLPKLKPSLKEEEDGFIVTSDPNVVDSAITYSKKFNDFLIDQNNDFAILVDNHARKRFFRLLRSRKDVLAPIIRYKWWKSITSGSLFINESKVSVESPIRTDITTIKIFKGDYFSSFLTNELSTFSVVHGGSGRPYIFHSGTSFFPEVVVENSRRIQEFGEYISGNHIGVSTIAISSDKYLCLWVQNKKAQQSVGLLAPTGSGSLDWKDARKAKSLKQAVVTGMNREFHEESNRRGMSLSYSQIEDTLLIGYFRRIIRGGKPEFVAISRLAVRRTELEPNEEEVEDRTYSDEMNHYPVKTFADLERTVRDLLEQDSNKLRLSVPLWANLLALNDAITSKPELVKKFYGF